MTSVRQLVAAVPLLLFALAPGGCGDDPDTTSTASASSAGGGSSSSAGGGAGGTGGDGGAPACPVLHPEATSLDFASVAWIGLTAKVDAPLDGYDKTRLAMELYEDDGSGLLPPLAPGSFDLGVGFDDNYGTCQHCVLLVAYDGLGQPRRAFFQASGTMELTKLDPLRFGVVVGEVRDVHLTEVTQDPDLSWHRVPHGLCYDVPAWSFDTRPIDGGACASAEDCPNEAAQICDVETKTCQPGQCSLTFDPPFCPEGSMCLTQIGDLLDANANVAGPAIGACYATCSPSSSGGCGAHEACVPLGPTQEVGVCLGIGDAQVGAPCDSPDVSTGCVEGAICVGERATCAPLCDYLRPTSGCPGGTYCTLENVCRPLDVGDLALAGETCNSASPELTDCAAQGDAFRGICMKFFPNDPTLTCERLCRTAVAHPCPGGDLCLPYFSNPSVGVCHPAPVCGDGIVDVIGGEICDDHNAVSGDGCGADCVTPELDALCAVADPLALDAFVTSTTDGGVRGYASACDPFIATPVKTYTFLPPGPGRLSLELDSARALGLSVLADCADDASEIGCREGTGGVQRLHVDVASTPAKPLLIVVRGASPLDFGAFGLVATFTPAVCGDGQVGGPEACDDGNTGGGDGCSADCTAIEWPELCAALPALDLATPVNGDLTGGLTAFDTSGVCGLFDGAGLQRAYAFTAPTAGTLSLSLDAPEDLVLYVEEDCTEVPSGTFLACSNSGFAGETESADVPLNAGQAITVIVAGFSEDDGGGFTLTASFGP